MSLKTFSQEIHEVKDEILLLSSMVEEAVMDAAEALKDNDLDNARQILLKDIIINRKRFEIELSIMVLMANPELLIAEINENHSVYSLAIVGMSRT
ncbi:MAG TPA: PhoU domain-containing protein [Anaerolineales bacterium]|nr:PhoU domain-containing protein [Anaerolineales bacterium]